MPSGVPWILVQNRMRIVNRLFPVILCSVLGLIGLVPTWSTAISDGTSRRTDRSQSDGRSDSTLSRAASACASMPGNRKCSLSRHTQYTESSRRAFAYDANASLRSQLDSIEIMADRGDPYATCVLARALDICVSEEYMLNVGDLEGGDIETLDEDELNSMQKTLELSRSAKAMCDGLTANDLSKYFHRMIESARLGDTKSMSRLTSFQLTMANGVDEVARRYASFYQENAERMLNESALAGEPEAILSVYHGYSSGRLDILGGSISLDVDLVKSLAAARTLETYADRRGGDELLSFIATTSQRLNRSEEMRMRILESAYSRNYRKKAVGSKIHSIENDDFPSVYCASRRQ